MTMKNKTTRIGWIARICGIMAIMFISMFALDAFEDGTVLHKLAAFGMHMIPSVVLFLVLILAWRYELAGGIVFILIGIGLAPFIYQLNFVRTHSIGVCLGILAMVNLPFVIVGTLFALSYFIIKKQGMSSSV
jgi:hypothetical protein